MLINKKANLTEISENGLKNLPKWLYTAIAVVYAWFSVDLNPNLSSIR
jgi:hypothetical protein